MFHLMGSCFLLFLCTSFVFFVDKKNFLTCSDDLSAEEYCSTMAKGNSAHGFCQSDQWPATLSWFPYAGFSSQSINQSMISLVDWHFLFTSPCFRTFLVDPCILQALEYTLRPLKNGCYYLCYMEIGPAGQYNRITHLPVLYVETDINSTEWIYNISNWKFQW